MDTPDHIMSDSKCGRSLASRKSATFSPPRLPLSDSVTLSTSQHNQAAVHQPTVKEEESHMEERQPSHLPAPNVEMLLRDFAILC